MPKSLTTRQAARYLGVSVPVLLKVIKPQMKKGRDWWKDNTGDPTNRYRWRRKTIRPWRQVTSVRAIDPIEKAS